MTRDQFVQKLKADLELWSVQAEEWEAKARAVRAELHSASAAAWQDVAQGYDGAWRELRSAFERARTRFGS